MSKEKAILQLFEEILKSDINIHERSNINIVTPFMTKDAKKINEKVINKISTYFRFPATIGILNLNAKFDYPGRDAQRMIFDINHPKNEQLKIKMPSKLIDWRLPYSTVVVTEDDECLVELKRKKINSDLIVSQNSIDQLKNYDIVRAISCDKLAPMLEQLENCFFVETIADSNLQANLASLAQWENTLLSLENSSIISMVDGNDQAYKELMSLVRLLNLKKEEKKTYDHIPKTIDEINKKLSIMIKELSVSGEELLLALSKNKLPTEIENMMTKLIYETGIDKNLLNITYPITVDEAELAKKMADDDSSSANKIENLLIKNSNAINMIPDNLRKIEASLLLYDFVSGINNYMREYDAACAEESDYLSMSQSRNILIDNPQPISFHLDSEALGSILTGANSGGKTTLIEHIIQLISLHSIGLPVSGKISLPRYQHVYYFSKSKGSTNKGAFETLLMQLTQIKAGAKTLILADELEAVTEPSVAANIIRSTLSFFTSKDCQAIFASHLGGVLEKNMPSRVRIDGIEAKGLDANSNLIVDHNPVLGRLAKSTPELILMRLAKKKKNDYLNSLVRELGISA